MKTAFGNSNPNLVAVAWESLPEQLCRLSRSEDALVRSRAADNPQLPLTCLAELANDVAHDVRISVAENPVTPLVILELLAEDDHADVRYAIAENANMPAYILSILSRDENPYVSARAHKTLARLAQQVIPILENCA
jgi:hypothetical protein